MTAAKADLLRRRGQQAPKPVTPLVECTLRVSPTLSRLLRKCAEAEAAGASPQNALLTPIGLQEREIAQLREQGRRANVELIEARGLIQELRREVETANDVIAEGDCKQKELRRLLKEGTDNETTMLQELSVAREHILDLERTIAVQQAELRRCVDTAGMNERSLFAVQAFANRLKNGDDFKIAALTTAEYDASQVDTAIAMYESKEVCALNALRPRRRPRDQVVAQGVRVASPSGRPCRSGPDAPTIAPRGLGSDPR
jgi:hypothetical protein